MNRLLNLVMLVCIGAAVVASFIYLGMELGEPGGSGNLNRMGATAQRVLSPDLSAGHPPAFGHGALGTRAMSSLAPRPAVVMVSDSRLCPTGPLEGE